MRSWCSQRQLKTHQYCETFQRHTKCSQNFPCQSGTCLSRSWCNLLLRRASMPRCQRIRCIYPQRTIDSFLEQQGLGIAPEGIRHMHWSPRLEHIYPCRNRDTLQDYRGCTRALRRLPGTCRWGNSCTIPDRAWSQCRIFQSTYRKKG